MTTATKTVADLMTGQDLLDLVRWDGESNFLALKRMPSGRIDLIDFGCEDTGSDLSDSTTDELMAQVREWLRCVECPEGDVEEAIEQAEAAIS